MADDLRAEEHLVEGLLDLLGQHVHQVAIGPGQQPGRHLDDGDLAAQRRVHAAELEADVATADDQQRSGHAFQVERRGRVHDPRAVEGQARHLRRLRPDGDDGVLEGHLLAAAVHLGDVQAGRPGQRRGASEVLDLACLDQLSGATGQAADDGVLEGAQLVEIDLRLAELHAPGGGMTRLFDEFGDVQECLGRDAATVDAHAARIGLAVDERDVHPEVRGVERGGVPAGAGANDDELGLRRHYSASTNGFSNASQTQRRKRAPSAPSITRWS